MKDLGIVGVIGRFKPPHLGGQAMLESLCERADKVIIGIGSSNRYNARNPFTAQESQEMIDSFLSKKYDNYTFVQVPDFGHIPEFADGARWKEYVRHSLGPLDHFISGNPYVSDLLKEEYDIILASSVMHEHLRRPLRSSLVRLELARFGSWQDLVPQEVSEYILSHKLDERFRQEFGLETLARFAQGKSVHGIEDITSERKNVEGDKE